MDQPLSAAGFWPTLLSLVLASAVVMGSPGPATMSVTAIGASFGFRRSLPYAAGIILGTAAVLAAVAAGLVSVLMAQPRLAPVLVGLSAVYMVYLAFRIATAPPLSAPGGRAGAPKFLGGFLFALANPKAYVAIAAVFGASTLGTTSAPGGTAIKIAVLTAMIVVIHLAWLVAGSAFARFLRRPLISRAVNLAFAAILLATTAMAFI